MIPLHYTYRQAVGFWFGPSSCVPWNCEETIHLCKGGYAGGLWRFTGERAGEEPIYSSSLGKACHRNGTAPAAPVGSLVSFISIVLQKSDNRCYRDSCCLCFDSEHCPRSQSVEMVCEAFSVLAMAVPTYRGMTGQGWDSCLKCLVHTNKPTPTACLSGGGTGRPKGPLASDKLITGGLSVYGMECAFRSASDLCWEAAFDMLFRGWIV